MVIVLSPLIIAIVTSLGLVVYSFVMLPCKAVQACKKKIAVEERRQLLASASYSSDRLDLVFTGGWSSCTDNLHRDARSQITSERPEERA